MINDLIDITSEFNADNGKRLDLSGWETATFQFVGSSGTIDITGSNDANAQTGVTDGNAFTSINFTPIQAINLANGTLVTSVAGDGLYKITVACKFIQVGGSGATATKVLVFVNKPY